VNGRLAKEEPNAAIALRNKLNQYAERKQTILIDVENDFNQGKVMATVLIGMPNDVDQRKSDKQPS
jgi:hypothetical protein